VSATPTSKFNVDEMFATLAKWIKPPRKAGGSPDDTGGGKPQELGNTPLPPLPGIDVAAGLSTTLNDPKLYRRLLGKFRDSQREFAARFAAARAGSDTTAPMREAHTLKGTAGNIGAKGVQAAAGLLERECEGGSPDRLDELLANTMKELEPVLAGIDAALAVGFAPIKLNTVVLRGVNDDELEKILLWAWERRLVPRFLEIMPIAEGAKLVGEHLVTAGDMRRLASLLADFYRCARPVPAAAERHQKHFEAAINDNRTQLLKPDYGLPVRLIEQVTQAQPELLGAPGTRPTAGATTAAPPRHTSASPARSKAAAACASARNWPPAALTATSRTS